MFLLASIWPWAFLPVQTAVCLSLGFLSKENSLNSLGTRVMTQASQLAGVVGMGCLEQPQQMVQNTALAPTHYITQLFSSHRAASEGPATSPSTESVLCPVQINNRTVWCPTDPGGKGWLRLDVFIRQLKSLGTKECSVQGPQQQSLLECINFKMEGHRGDRKQRDI